MKASDMIYWPNKFNATDWPPGTLEHMDSYLFTNVIFPLRDISGIPMWPSAYFDAHVRHEGNSAHSTKGGTRLAYGTDMHVSTIKQMIEIMVEADQLPGANGIGIYFDTNTPMVHLDIRAEPLMWLRTSKGEYVYRECDVIKFYHTLSNELKLKGL